MKARTWLCAVGLFGFSCGGGGTSKPITLDEFCTQKADKECQVATRLCGATSADPCKTARKATCMEFAAAASIPPRVFKPENAADCLAKTDALYRRDDTLKPNDLAVVDDACNYVFQGNVKKVAPGVTETCKNKYDCADRVICDKTFCAAQAMVGGSASCGNPGQVCVAGFYCTGVVAFCTAKKAAGAACDAANPCVENLRCSGGTCVDRVSSGGSCATNDDCVPAAPFCDVYLNNVCSTGLRFAATSNSCTAFIGGGQGGSTGGAGGSGGGTGGAGGSTGAGGSDAGADAPGAEAG